MAGDPAYLFRAGGQDNPRSPAYGNRGGAPVYRWAKQIARQYARDKDKSFIEELYQNGLVELTKLMKPGYDQSNAAFISWVTRNVQGAMEGGTSGTGEEAVKAMGDVAKDSGLVGLKGLLRARTPDEARNVANQVKGKYATDRHHDRHTDNPFGPYSFAIHKLANDYASALESGDTEAQDRVRQQVEALIEKIDSDKDMVLGAATGAGQAVSTQDRRTSVGIASMDMPNSTGEGTMGDSIGDENAMDGEDVVDQESVRFVLELGLQYDIGQLLGGSPKVQQMAKEFGLKPGENIGGKFTAGEYRCLLRKLGPSASSYPGKGNPRKAVSVPRDEKGWWSPGEDPEIEPIPGGPGRWQSIWIRNGYQAMGDTEIAREFTAECLEFQKLGINGSKARMEKAAAGKEVISKVAIGNTVKSGVLKMKILGQLHRHELGLDESLARRLGFPLVEDFDPIDRRLINEAFSFVIRTLTRSVIQESALTPVEKETMIEHSNITWRAK